MWVWVGVALGSTRWWRAHQAARTLTAHGVVNGKQQQSRLVSGTFVLGHPSHLSLLFPPHGSTLRGALAISSLRTPPSRRCRMLAISIHGVTVNTDQ